MTTQERKVIELALNALQTLHDENMDYLTRNKLGGENNQCMVFAREAIIAIKEALAQPQPQRKPLSDEEIEDLYFDKFSMGELKAFARTIEAAHGIKGD